MSYEKETAGRYRKRATKLRSMPTTYEDREIARAVARVAQDYDLMARVFDNIDEASLASLRARNAN
jgi:hypothetical protein